MGKYDSWRVICRVTVGVILFCIIGAIFLRIIGIDIRREKMTEAEYINTVTEQYYSYNEEDNTYKIAFPDEITSYIGSKQIEEYVENNYSIEKICSEISVLPEDEYNYDISYDIYNDSPEPGVTHDYGTGWKATYLIRRSIVVNKDCIDRNDIDIKALVYKYSCVPYEEYKTRFFYEIADSIFVILVFGIVPLGIWWGIFFICMIYIDKGFLALYIRDQKNAEKRQINADMPSFVEKVKPFSMEDGMVMFVSNMDEYRQNNSNEIIGVSDNLNVKLYDVFYTPDGRKCVARRVERYAPDKYGPYIPIVHIPRYGEYSFARDFTDLREVIIKLDINSYGPWCEYKIIDVKTGKDKVGMSRFNNPVNSTIKREYWKAKGFLDALRCFNRPCNITVECEKDPVIDMVASGVFDKGDRSCRELRAEMMKHNITIE